MAVGLAGNVVQFMEFAGKMISEIQTILRTGSPTSLPDLKNLTEELMKQSDTIHSCLNDNNSQRSPEDEVRSPGR